jgi:enoyl-CoA hydratase
VADSHASISEKDGVIKVTIDRPAKLNAISPEVTALLWEAVRSLGDREDLRVMVITAVGPYFTAGIDLAHIPGDRRGGRIPSDVAYRRQYRQHHLLYDEFEAIEKPIVLAAQAPCLGAGVEMAASCDFRLAAASAYFELSEIRLGVLPGSGGTSRVTRLVGPHWGKWIAMAGKRVDAEQARTIGFVHDVFPDDTFHEQVEEFARHLVAIPGEALGVAKLVVDMVADMDRTDQRHLERIANSPLNASDEWESRTSRFNKA